MKRKDKDRLSFLFFYFLENSKQMELIEKERTELNLAWKESERKRR